MFNFLLYRYRAGKITKEELAAYVPRFITAEQYEQITGEPL